MLVQLTSSCTDAISLAGHAVTQVFDRAALEEFIATSLKPERREFLGRCLTPEELAVFQREPRVGKNERPLVDEEGFAVRRDLFCRAVARRDLNGGALVRVGDQLIT